MLRKYFHSRLQKPGLAPGSLVYLGRDADGVHPELTLLKYNHECYEEYVLSEPNECLKHLSDEHVIWINLAGVHEIDYVQKTGVMFNLNPLVLEDILNTSHPAKIEDQGEYIFAIYKILKFNAITNTIDTEQLSMVAKEGLIITFAQKKHDILAPVIERIKDIRKKIRSRKSDYLMYAISDCIVDHYFPALNEVAEKIEEIESQVLSNNSAISLNDIYKLKSSLFYFRKMVNPIIEALRIITKDRTSFIKEDTYIFINDLQDHLDQILDTISNFREALSALTDTYFSMTSTRMNEVMKVLTIFASVFMPLTFIAGIYGMNFQNMPELHWKWGYYVVIGLMSAVFGVMIVYFRRKKWL